MVAEGSEGVDMARFGVWMGLVSFLPSICRCFTQSVALSRTQFLVYLQVNWRLQPGFIINFYCLFWPQFIKSKVLQNHILYKAQNWEYLLHVAKLSRWSIITFVPLNLIGWVLSWGKVISWPVRTQSTVVLSITLSTIGALHSLVLICRRLKFDLHFPSLRGKVKGFSDVDLNYFQGATRNCWETHSIPPSKLVEDRKLHTGKAGVALSTVNIKERDVLYYTSV